MTQQQREKPAIEQQQKQKVAVPRLDEATLRERAVLVKFSIGRYYGTGADHEVVEKVRAHAGASNGNIGSFTKRMMSREVLADINRITNEARRFHKSKTLMWDDTYRVLGVDAFEEYKGEMTKFEHRFNQAVEAYMKVYTDKVAEQKQRLGSLWKASDYPAPDEMRKRFRFDLHMAVIADTKDIRLSLSAEHVKQIQAEEQQRLHASLVTAVTDVAERLQEAMTEFREAMSEKDDEVRASVTRPLATLCAVLPQLNIMKDPTIAALSAEIQKEFVGMDIAAAREDKVLRDTAVKKADAILSRIAVFKKGAK